jgi:hypothetical protein
VAPSDDLPPQRRPLFFPVVIAGVFLTIIGLSVGLVMGTRAKDEARAERLQPTAPTLAPTVEPTPAAAQCRRETQDAAQRYNPSGTLVIVLRVRTASSEVWICQDSAGRMYYHANRGGVDAVWIEGKTALLLPDVVPYGDGYRVTSAADSNGRTTTFDVNQQRLLITHKDGREEEQPTVPQ